MNVRVTMVLDLSDEWFDKTGVDSVGGLQGTLAREIPRRMARHAVVESVEVGEAGDPIEPDSIFDERGGI